MNQVWSACSIITPGPYILVENLSYLWKHILAEHCDSEKQKAISLSWETCPTISNKDYFFIRRTSNNHLHLWLLTNIPERQWHLQSHLGSAKDMWQRGQQGELSGLLFARDSLTPNLLCGQGYQANFFLSKKPSGDGLFEEDNVLRLLSWCLRWLF